ARRGTSAPRGAPVPERTVSSACPCQIPSLAQVYAKGVRMSRARSRPGQFLSCLADPALPVPLEDAQQKLDMPVDVFIAAQLLPVPHNVVVGHCEHWKGVLDRDGPVRGRWTRRLFPWSDQQRRPEIRLEAGRLTIEADELRPRYVVDQL